MLLPPTIRRVTFARTVRTVLTPNEGGRYGRASSVRECRDHRQCYICQTHTLALAHIKRFIGFNELACTTQRAFHAVMSFEIRLDMTNAALQAIRGQVFMDSWRPLYAKCSKRYKRRNQLAHFHLFADETRRSGYRLHLAPSIFDGRAIQRWQNKAPRFNGCQIIAIGNSFSTLATSLTRLLLIPRRQVETRILASPEQEAHPRPEPPTEDAPSDRAPEAPPEPSQE